MSNDGAPQADIPDMDAIERDERTIESLAQGEPVEQNADRAVHMLAAERDRCRKPFDPDAFDFFADQRIEPENVQLETIGLILHASIVLSSVTAFYAIVTDHLAFGGVLLAVGALCLVAVLLLRRVR